MRTHKKLANGDIETTDTRVTVATVEEMDKQIASFQRQKDQAQDNIDLVEEMKNTK